MKIKKLIVPLVVVGIVVGIFTGCSAKTEEKKVETVVTENLNVEGLPILKEPETFKIAVQQMSTAVQVKDKPIVKQLEEETNVKIEWIEIPGSEATWKEKINIMFASGDLPDAFMSNVNTSLYYEQLVELDDMITKYGPNIQEKILSQERYERSLKAPDGKIHQLPGGDEGIHNQVDKTLWINQVWLDKLGLEMPTTTEEYYTVLKAFKEKDPNGNGQADEIPLTFNGIHTWANGMGDLFGAFGVPESEKHVFMKEDKVIFAAQQPEYYEALKWFNQLFKEGLIDQEAFSNSAEQYSARGKGKDVIGSAVSWRIATLVDPDKVNDYNYVLPLKGPSGIQMCMLNDLTQTEGFAISTSCKNPEALVRWYDYVNSSMDLALEVGRGVEGEFWEKTDAGYMFIDLEENLPEGMTMNDWRQNRSFSGQTPSLWTTEMDSSMIPNPAKPLDLKKEAVQKSVPYGVSVLPNGSDTVENSERRAMLLTDIDTYISKFVADTVINGIDDTKWEEHLKALESLKVEEYVSLCQDYVTRMAE